jgi:hypothetical protein
MQAGEPGCIRILFRQQRGGFVLALQRSHQPCCVRRH